MKIENDKYYTPRELAKRLIDKTFEIIGKDNIGEIVEPSAGDGAFSDQLPSCLAIDLVPESENIIQADFLKYPMEYSEGRLFIGNPPFGEHNSLIRHFFKKCVLYGDYIAFILPIAYLDSDVSLYEFDLIYSEDLGLQHYTDRDLHCCFNIYKRPDKGNCNQIQDYTLNEITIIEHRRKKGEYHTGKNKDIPDNFVYSMCNWGNGCLGKVPTFIGEYAQEVYFYCDKPEIIAKMVKLLEFDKVREYAKSISSARVSVMKLYKYLYENIEETTLKYPPVKDNSISFWDEE